MTIRLQCGEVPKKSSRCRSGTFTAVHLLNFHFHACLRMGESWERFSQFNALGEAGEAVA
jgi:hypothetical protein